MSEEFVVSFCQELIRAPSLPGHEEYAAEVVVRAMHDFEFDTVATDKYGSVIGIRKGSAPGPTLLLDAHLDVVPATDLDQWQHDPFRGEISDQRIWGRGACDDKGVLAGMLCGVGGVPSELFRGEIIVSASVCEEILTGAALAHILDCYAPAMVIVGEPTGLKLGTAQKGRAGIVVHTRGRGAHTSRPELGDNAVYRMIDAILRLRSLELPGDSELGRGILELTEIVSEPFPGGGVVPFGCRAHFVERTMPGETEEQVLTRLQNAVHGLDNVSVQFDQLTQQCYTGNTLSTLDFVAGWHAIGENVWQARILAELQDAGLSTKTFAAPYGTNASTSAGIRGIPTVIFGPGSIEQAHTVDEWIAIDELLMSKRAYAAIIKACLGI